MAHIREERITNLLSMAQRARRIVSGAFAVEQALKSREAVLVLVAADASDETKKDYAILADRYKVPCLEGLDREMLGHCLGKEYRAVAALTDQGFAKKLRELMKDP